MFNLIIEKFLDALALVGTEHYKATMTPCEWLHFQRVWAALFKESVRRLFYEELVLENKFRGDEFEELALLMDRIDERFRLGTEIRSQKDHQVYLERERVLHNLAQLASLFTFLTSIQYPILVIQAIPLFVIVLLLLINRFNIKLLKQTALWGSLVSLGYVGLMTVSSLHNWADFQRVTYLLPSKLTSYAHVGNFMDFYRPCSVELEEEPADLLSIPFGYDFLSLFLLLLTAFLIFICVLSSWESITFKLKEFYILLFLIAFFLYNVFTVLDIFFFYIFFEAILIPMFLLVGIWGSRYRRIHAAYQFFVYTLCGSLVMLLGIITLYLHTGSTSWFVLVCADLPFYKESFVWMTFFIAFSVKVPIVPFHIWLPEAHVEAPTVGSVLLAGILLKMGTYGLLRFSIPFFPNATVYFAPLVFTISLISIIYSSLTTIRQVDLKKIIAYSSVAHMNFVTLGIFSLDLQGIEGSIFLMLGHGVVSSALFLCIGVLYDRYHTRLLPYYGGVVFGMPLFSLCFFIFTLGNISLPGTVNFIGEFLILISLFSQSILATILALVGVVLGAVYAMWLYNRVVFGLVNSKFLFKFNDLNRREAFILGLLAFLTFALGFFPNIVLNHLHLSCSTILLFT